MGIPFEDTLNATLEKDDDNSYGVAQAVLASIEDAASDAGAAAGAAATAQAAADAAATAAATATAAIAGLSTAAATAQATADAAATAAAAAVAAIAGLTPGTLGSRAKKPVTPDARDEEFDSSTTINSAFNWYTAGGALLTTAKAALALTTPANPRYQLHTDRRPGWLCVQSSLAGFSYLLKPITLAANETILTRMVMPLFLNSGSGARSLSVCVAAAKAGPLPDVAVNSIRVGIRQAAGVVPVIFGDTYTAGAGVAIVSDQFIGTLAGVEYILISKVGTSYYVHWCTGDGGGEIVRAFTWTGTPAYVGWAFEAQADPGIATAGNIVSGSPIFQIDFLRFTTTDYHLLPF